MSVLSERLRELRGSQSQREMAEAIGIKYQAWDRYEKGKVTPGADILQQICRIHAVSSDWLLGLADDPKSEAIGQRPQTVNLEELRTVAQTLVEQSNALAGTLKRLKKMV